MGIICKEGTFQHANTCWWLFSFHSNSMQIRNKRTETVPVQPRGNSWKIPFLWRRTFYRWYGTFKALNPLSVNKKNVWFVPIVLPFFWTASVNLPSRVCNHCKWSTDCTVLFWTFTSLSLLYLWGRNHWRSYWRCVRWMQWLLRERIAWSSYWSVIWE